jgi:hypothetical protein
VSRASLFCPLIMPDHAMSLREFDSWLTVELVNKIVLNLGHYT